MSASDPHTTRSRAPRVVRPFLALLGWAHLASAQPEPSAPELAVARKLAQEGVALAEQGACGPAIEKLSQADRIYKAPVILAALGECQIKLGKLVLGSENLRGALRLPDQGRDVVRQAQGRAQRLLDTTLPRIARLRINARLPSGVAPRLSLDGEALRATLLETEILIDPGAHVVELGASGYSTARKEITLAEGALGSVSLEPQPDPTAAPTASASASAAPTSAPSAPSASSVVPPASAPAMPPEQPSPERRYAAYALFGVGAVGLVAGGFFAYRASSQKADLDATCTGKICPLASEDTYDSARTSATLATVGVGVGLGAAAAGLLLLLTEPAPRGRSARRLPLYVSSGPSPVGLGIAGGF